MKPVGLKWFISGKSVASVILRSKNKMSEMHIFIITLYTVNATGLVFPSPNSTSCAFTTWQFILQPQLNSSAPQFTQSLSAFLYQNLALWSSLHVTNAGPVGEWLIHRTTPLWPGTYEPRHEKTCVCICEQQRCRSVCAPAQSL